VSGPVRLAGRIALVTGAGGPMGRAIAQRFAQEGASLVLAEISGNRLREGQAAVEASLAPGAGVVAQRADVTQREEAQAVADAGLARFGRIDILINVVGGIRGTTLFAPLLELDEARWDDTFRLNLKANFHLVRLVAPGMLDRRYGKIVNLSSMNFAGELGSSDYGAAKAAVASLTRTLALELAPHVNVNCIAPGTIRTTVVSRMPPEELDRYAAKPPLKRLGEPLDIANAALFLASDEASYVTGATFLVDGGLTASYVTPE
jgi:NAD(P)-dependent dehydrogenase (short-subunit alcohol dehydrogenase family)